MSVSVNNSGGGSSIPDLTNSTTISTIAYNENLTKNTFVDCNNGLVQTELVENYRIPLKRVYNDLTYDLYDVKYLGNNKFIALYNYPRAGNTTSSQAYTRYVFYSLDQNSNQITVLNDTNSYTNLYYANTRITVLDEWTVVREMHTDYSAACYLYMSIGTINSNYSITWGSAVRVITGYGTSNDRVHPIDFQTIGTDKVAILCRSRVSSSYYGCICTALTVDRANSTFIIPSDITVGRSSTYNRVVFDYSDSAGDTLLDSNRSCILINDVNNDGVFLICASNENSYTGSKINRCVMNSDGYTYTVTTLKTISAGFGSNIGGSTVYGFRYAYLPNTDNIIITSYLLSAASTYAYGLYLYDGTSIVDVSDIPSLDGHSLLTTKQIVSVSSDKFVVYSSDGYLLYKVVNNNSIALVSAEMVDFSVVTYKYVSSIVSQYVGGESTYFISYQFIYNGDKTIDFLGGFYYKYYTVSKSISDNSKYYGLIKDSIDSSYYSPDYLVEYNILNNGALISHRDGWTEGTTGSSYNKYSTYGGTYNEYMDAYTRLYATSTSYNSRPMLTQTFSPSISGNTASTNVVLYACVYALASSSDTTDFRIGLDNYKNGSTTKTITLLCDASDRTTTVVPKDDTFHLFSRIFNTYYTTGDYYEYLDASMQYASSTKTAKDALVKYFKIVNLTERFGRGNEPTIEWCDANIAPLGPRKLTIPGCSDVIAPNITVVESIDAGLQSSTAYAERSAAITFSNIIAEPKSFVVTQTDRSGRTLDGYRVISVSFDGTTKELVYAYSSGLSTATSTSTTNFTYTYTESATSANTFKITASGNPYFEYNYKLFYTI